MANGASVVSGLKEAASREVALEGGIVSSTSNDARKESPFGNDEHLCIILSQETYDTVMEVVTRASERGLVDTFDYWLNSIVKTGAQAKLRTWNDRDVVSLFNTVQNSKLSQSARRAAATKLQKLLEV